MEGAGLTLRVTPPRCADFQIDFDAFAQLVDENTAAVLINSPNNPSGAAYSVETLQQLACFLTEASAKYGHHIFLISDEPYREIAFGGAVTPYPAKFYDDTLTCYSFSKSLSVPGERIGYVAANPPVRGRGVYCADVRSDFPRDRPQLPVLPDSDGRGALPGRDERFVRLRDEYEPDL